MAGASTGIGVMGSQGSALRLFEEPAQMAPNASKIHWLSIPEVQVRYNVRATGKPDLGWHVYCLSFVPRARIRRARMLILGCGSGWLERDLFRRGAFEHCDVVDPSAEAVEAAQALAAAEGCSGISYRVADPREIELPPESYDAIWSDNALSRTGDLEHLGGQMAGALAPTGFLFANEYVGPNRYAFLQPQREAMQTAFSLIPRRYRRRADRPGAELLREVELPGRQGVGGDDAPIASAEVIRVLRSRFELVQCRALGGSILQFVLYGIAPNFKAQDRIAGLVLEMLFRIEDVLVDGGELASDFALIVACPRAGRSGLAAAAQDGPRAACNPTYSRR